MTDKQRILVVEDDPLVSEVIAAALDDEYSIRVVESPQRTLWTCCGRRLPADAAGLHPARRRGCRPDPGADRVGTAVVLMSGDPGRMAKLTDQPRPFVLKPFTLTGLLETVRGVMPA